MDFGFGLDLGCWGFCAGGGTPPISGAIRVGEYPATFDEVRILLYAPGDTVTPLTTYSHSDCSQGTYCIWLGVPTDTLACGYLARAVRWDDVRTGLEPLFLDPPAPCRLDVMVGYQGPDFELPAYAPLSTPFTVTGTVYSGALPAAAGAATVRIPLRTPTEAAIAQTDSTGRYTFATTDGAQRFHLCRNVGAEVTVGTSYEAVFLGSVPAQRCGDRRELPDARLGGWRMVAWGHVQDADGPVGSKAARVELLSAADSSVVGEAGWTQDDGGYRIWFPFGYQEAGCQFLLRATKGTTSQTRALPGAPNGPCTTRFEYFVFP
jgi:hypothetical protein